MAVLLGTDVTVIAQNVEQRLLTFLSALTTTTIISDIRAIYWVEEGAEPPPSQTGQRDILFEFDKDEIENFQGDGRFYLIKSGLFLYFRTSRALDYTSNRRDWFLNQKPLLSSLSDALDGFFPVDGSSNALTVEGFVPRDYSTTRRSRDTTTWGYTIGSWAFHYYANTDKSIVVA